MTTVTKNTPDLFDQRHGGPFDRGAADSHYRQRPKPHYFKGGSFMSEQVTADQMTVEELRAYFAGYRWNNIYGTKKEW